MGRIALIKDGKVSTIIVADMAFAMALNEGTPVDVTEVSPFPGPGWSYDGGGFTAPVVVEIPEPPPPVVIPTITMVQARLALLAIGKLADVGAVLSSLPEPQQSAAKIEWEYRATVARDNALVNALGPALGLSDARLDELFVSAAAY